MFRHRLILVLGKQNFVPQVRQRRRINELNLTLSEALSWYRKVNSHWWLSYLKKEGEASQQQVKSYSRRTTTDKAADLVSRNTQATAVKDTGLWLQELRTGNCFPLLASQHHSGASTVCQTPHWREMKVREGEKHENQVWRGLLSFSSPKAFVYTIKLNRKVHLGKDWTDDAILWQTECQDQVQMPKTGRRKTSSIHQPWRGVGPRYCNRLYKTNMDKNRAPWEQGAHSLGKTGINCRAVPSAHVSTAGCWKGRPALGLLGP